MGSPLNPMTDYYPLLPVSIVVPVYNGERTVQRCVESLIAQNYPADLLEIIFVDNKSKDKTCLILQPYVNSGRIVLISETSVLNAYGARNTGVRAAKGEIIAFTDADCEATPNWLREITNSFQDPDIGCVAGEILPAQPISVIEKYGDESFLSQRKGVGQQFPPVKGGNCAFRKKIFYEVGFFRDDHPSGGDTELAWRMAQKSHYKIKVNLNSVVFHHNVSSMRDFIKQSMRYGTHIYLSDLPLPDQTYKKRPSFYNAVITTFIFSAAFIKRTFLTLTGLQPTTIHRQDYDIYIMKPILRIISEWAQWAGYRFASKKNNLLR